MTMTARAGRLAAVAALALTTASQGVTAEAADAGALYEVTITNVTRGQSLTPVLVATHLPGVPLFTLGQPAAPELQAVAEEGDLGPLMTRTEGSGVVFDMQTTTGLTGPGQSQTVYVRARGPFTRISAVAMLIPTNDGFFAVSGEELPRGRERLTVDARAYDAGSERNDELCASIPGPSSTSAADPAAADSRAAARRDTSTSMPASTASATSRPASATGTTRWST
ncbi:MAG: spondin domain-containing protein [Vicinamibacterales bacterium]